MLVKQTGDVTVDDARVKENIPAENTSEIEKSFTSENGVVLRNSCSGEGRQAGVDVNFPLLMTHGQAAFSGHETGLLERHPRLCTHRTVWKPPSERESRPRTKCVNSRVQTGYLQIKCGPQMCFSG